MLKNTVIEKINHVKLPPVVDKETAKILESEIAKWMDLPVQLHVFDFGLVIKFHAAFYGPMTKFKKDIERSKKGKVISINLKSEILQKVQSDGMESAVGHLKNVANIDAGKNKDLAPNIKKYMVKYFADAARDSLLTMFGVDLAPIEPTSKVPADLSIERIHKIAALDGIGPTIKCKLRLYLDKPCVEGLTRAATLSSAPDDDMVNSTAAELLNLIYGSAKSKLNNDRGYQLQPKIPQLISAAQVDTERKSFSGESNWLSFRTPYGAFFLEVFFAK